MWRFYISKNPQAAITHCSWHNLNLALAKSMKIQVNGNTLKQLKTIQIFFNTSPKRESLLDYNVKLRCNTSSKNRSVLLETCKIRWSERNKSYKRFYLALPHLLEKLSISLCSDHLKDIQKTINLFVPNAPFLYPPKTLENLTVF